MTYSVDDHSSIQRSGHGGAIFRVVDRSHHGMIVALEEEIRSSVSERVLINCAATGVK